MPVAQHICLSVFTIISVKIKTKTERQSCCANSTFVPSIEEVTSLTKKKKNKSIFRNQRWILSQMFDFHGIPRDIVFGEILTKMRRLSHFFIFDKILDVVKIHDFDSEINEDYENQAYFCIETIVFFIWMQKTRKK